MKLSFLPVIVFVIVDAASFVLCLAPPMPQHVPSTFQVTTIIGPSISVSSSTTLLSESQPQSSVNIDKTIYKSLEKETRGVEKLAKQDERKVRVEKSREGFFEYEAKMAEIQEARIEAAEQKAIDEAIKDKKEFERLQALELKLEEEAERAETKQEKAVRLKEAQALKKQEKDVLRKEKKAERAEKVFLAEEIQEEKILKRKEDALSAVSKSMTMHFINCTPQHPRLI
jgi:hypothetical protein